MLKQKLVKNLLPYLVVFIALFFAGLVSFLLVSPTDSGKAKYSENNIQGVTKIASVVTPTPQPSASIETKPFIKVVSYATPSPTLHTFTPTPIPSGSPTTNSQSNNSVATQNVTPTPTPSQSPQNNQVSVSINSSSSFTVSANDGVNQCDVLNKSLADGKISSLNMRYDSNYGTYAVYQINGVGKENSVWWTYTVNGQSPNQGCSYIKAKNNDNVEWKYIGS